MPSATNPESDPPLDAGRVLAQSLAVVASNAGAMAMLTVLIHLPILAAQLYLIVVPTAEIRAQQGQVALLSNPCLRHDEPPRRGPLAAVVPG